LYEIYVTKVYKYTKNIFSTAFTGSYTLCEASNSLIDEFTAPNHGWGAVNNYYQMAVKIK
jgi:hypothetical protein